MKKTKFSESQIVNTLKEAEAGVSVEDLSRQHGFSKAIFYKWKTKYGWMSISEVKRMKELEEENRRLEQIPVPYTVRPRKTAFFKGVFEC